MGVPTSHSHAHFAKLLAFGALVAFTTAVATGRADSAQLPPQTKIRLTVVQWMPTKGVYEQWGALGGEYLITENGAVTLPLIGSVSVGELDSTALATAIAKRVRDKVGLVDMPAATVEVVEYPPVYVVGDVATPGEYRFRTGLTVLQALAMSGGEARSTDQAESPQAVTRLLGDLQATDDSILRSGAKIRRLEAEMAGAKEIEFSQLGGAGDPSAASIFSQEKAIFAARANMLTRAAKSLSDLRVLLNEEIKVLEEKIRSSDEDIASVEEQLRSTKALIEKGAIVPSRQAEVERTLRSYHGDRLDLVTSIMRARQNITQATRDLEGLYDKRQSEVASELQAERATLVQLELKRDTSQKLLRDTLSAAGTLKPPSTRPLLTFTIVRNDAGKITEIEGSETAALSPGDVVKVTRHPPEDSSPAATGSLTSAGMQPRQVSQ